MSHAVHTIEDCLETILGYTSLSSSTFRTLSTDYSVFSSIAKQVAKQTPLTDRQYNLLLEKLSETYYSAQFAACNIGNEQYSIALSQTRYPLREIDRSKYVTVVDTLPESAARSKKQDAIAGNAWIKVGFPFSKKTIAIINDLASQTRVHAHESGSRDHYFKLDEYAVYKIVSEFKDKEFEIDKELLDWYERITVIVNNRQAYLPSIADGITSNLHQTSAEYLESTLGKPSASNIVKYKDRSLLFDIRQFDTSLLNEGIKNVSPLTAKIVERTSPHILIKPSDWDFSKLIESLVELDRTPLLIILKPEDALEDLKKVHAALDKFFDKDDISVLFRLDNNTNAKFNKYVRDNGLNSPVTENTKVAIISKDKLPKPLLKADWVPDCVLRVGSTRIQHKVDSWTQECDLVIHYDTAALSWFSMQVKRRKIENL